MCNRKSDGGSSGKRGVDGTWGSNRLALVTCDRLAGEEGRSQIRCCRKRRDEDEGDGMH